MTGSGTIGDPYILYNVSDLQTMPYGAGVYVELGNDIECAGFDFIPIGNYGATFVQVHFDGKGFTIKNLTINQPTQSYVGLFGLLRDSTNTVIQNVKFTGCNITGISSVGCLAGSISLPG
jgi:hypothetical protein